MNDTPRPKTNRVLSSITALLIGTSGAGLFFYLTMPLPWMTGSMVFTTIAALAGVRISFPGNIRFVMISIIGIMIGSAFTPEMLSLLGKWAISISVLSFYTVFITVGLFYILYKRGRFGPVTSYFSAAPGGLNEMIMLGSSLGGDDRVISLMHSTRILITVLIIPIWFRLFEGYQPGSAFLGGFSFDIGLTDAVVLTLCGVVGYLIAKALRFPAPTLIGPMLLSGIVHLAGLSDATPPGPLIAAAQIIMGITIGVRFNGVSVKRVTGVMVTGAVTTLIMLAAAMAFALVLERITGLPYPAILLAFAPGGLTEMSLISLSMGIDSAYVSIHHLVRVILIIMAAPLIFRILSKYINLKDEENSGL